MHRLSLESRPSYFEVQVVSMILTLRLKKVLLQLLNLRRETRRNKTTRPLTLVLLSVKLLVVTIRVMELIDLFTATWAALFLENALEI